jgi:hypothetical protein
MMQHRKAVSLPMTIDYIVSKDKIACFICNNDYGIVLANKRFGLRAISQSVRTSDFTDHLPSKW